MDTLFGGKNSYFATPRSQYNESQGKGDWKADLLKQQQGK
jgi:hypothetical protein